MVHGARISDLDPLLTREVHVGEDVVAGGVHEGAELVLVLAQGIGDSIPLGLRLGLAFLGEDRLQHGRDRGALLGRGVRQGVAHPVNPAALLGSIEHAACGRPQALLVISDHKLHAAQAGVGEVAQEVRPERPGPRGACGNDQKLALAVLAELRD